MDGFSDVHPQIWTLPTSNGTLTIGWSFVFLAYFLHPAVESAYHKIRAYRAWIALEKRQAVEVTNYPMMAEIFRGRKRWDAARIITVILAAFSFASWGMELSMGIAHFNNGADLLSRPPPVWLRNDSESWQVVDKRHLQYDTGAWKELDNVFAEEGYANSMYYMEESDEWVYFRARSGGKIQGNVRVAEWFDGEEETEHQLYFNDSTVTVDSLECSENGTEHHLYVGEETSAWGTVVTCNGGPSVVDSNIEESSPPAIILSSSEGVVYVVVEESSSYPSFLYSVWTPEDPNSSPVKLHHVFHIASAARLAEAVVTGIANNVTTGGGCFGLLREYSDDPDPYNSDLDRASPFGEHPTGDNVDDVRFLENLEAGVEINMDALLCFVWLLVLTLIGIAWSIFLRSRIGMDVYNRDELIRAVSLQGAEAANDTPPSTTHIVVYKEDNGHISVIVSEANDNKICDIKSWCARLFRTGSKAIENDGEPVLIDTSLRERGDSFGQTAAPVGPRTVFLEGARTGMSRAYRGPDGNFRGPTSIALSISPVLSASPVVSSPVSLTGTPLPRGPSPAYAARKNMTAAGKRDTSIIFNSVCTPGGSSSSSEQVNTDSGDVEMGELGAHDATG